MTKPEYTGKRSLDYSLWHREKLPSWCYTIDIDWVEIRGNKIVAIIETKDIRARNLNNWRIDKMLQIANALGVPCYVIHHNLAIAKEPKEKSFRVMDLRTNITKIYNEEQYIEFLKQL